MSQEASVPAQLHQGPDVLRHRTPLDEEDLSTYRSRFCSSFSCEPSPAEASSSCPVSSSSSSSSDNKRSSSKKRKEFFEEESPYGPGSDSFFPEGSNDFPPEDAAGSRPAGEAQLDTGGMVYDASQNYKCKDATHRRVASPHGERITKKASNKPQMEKRRRKRINDSVEELRKYILELFRLDPSRHDKLEKADILEMTVQYIEHMKSQTVIIDRNEVNGENKPLRLESKKLSKDLSTSFIGRGAGGDNGYKLNNTFNEPPVTFIIQAAPPPQILQPLQNVPREQCLVGYHANSLGTQPSIVPGTQTPVIQLNITNNITGPHDLYQTTQHLPCPAEKVYSSPISPDTTTNDIYQEPSYREYPISYHEPSPPTPYDDKPQYEDFPNSNIKFVYPESNNQLVLGAISLPQNQSPFTAATKDTSPAKGVTHRRPIAPKPSKRKEECVKVRMAIPQINQNLPEPQEPVWRPWDASRKILKPHMVH